MIARIGERCIYHAIISVFLRRLEQWKKSHPRRKGFTAADFGQQIAREIGGDATVVTGGAVKKKKPMRRRRGGGASAAAL